MNRRAFLSTLSAALAGATLDPERLLWRPGAKTIFLPPTVEFTFITPTWIGKEALRQAHNNINLARLLLLDKPAPALIGATVAVRVPQRFARG